MTPKYVRLQVQKALQELGAPRMSYAPSVELTELKNIVSTVSGRLMRLVRRIQKENGDGTRRLPMSKLS